MYKLVLLLTISAAPALANNLYLDKFNQAVQDLADNLDDIHVHKETIITPIYVPSTVSTTTTHSNHATSTVTTVTPPRIEQKMHTYYHYTTDTDAAEDSLNHYQQAYRKLKLKLFLKSCKYGILNGAVSYLVPALIERATNHKLSTPVKLALTGTVALCHPQMSLPTTPYYQLPELTQQKNLFSMTDRHFWHAVFTQLGAGTVTHLILKGLDLTYLNQ